MLNHLFLQFSVVFFVSEYILYSLSNHLSRKILIYFLKVGIESSAQFAYYHSIPTGAITFGLQSERQ
jgi:hypothetical protein